MSSFQQRSMHSAKKQESMAHIQRKKAISSNCPSDAQMSSLLDEDLNCLF